MQPQNHTSRYHCSNQNQIPSESFSQQVLYPHQPPPYPVYQVAAQPQYPTLGQYACYQSQNNYQAYPCISQTQIQLTSYQHQIPYPQPYQTLPQAPIQAYNNHPLNYNHHTSQSKSHPNHTESPSETQLQNTLKGMHNKVYRIRHKTIYCQNCLFINDFMHIYIC